MHGSAEPAARPVRSVPEDMSKRLIVALDVPTSARALSTVTRLDGIVSFYKIGYWLMFAEGTDRLITDLIANGNDVFLDFKIYDIPETAKQGVARAKDRGVKFVTVHGDEEIMRAAVAGKGDAEYPKIFTITVLTSMDDDDLREMGYRLTVKQLIELRVRKSLECGCDGIIASAADNPNEIRSLVRNEGLLIATPAIRLPGAPSNDQKRQATPHDAIRDGADYLVVGRPIINAPDPAAAARMIIADMERGAESARRKA
jgi:orotidine-5'-phosphate decarboxylase